MKGELHEAARRPTLSEGLEAVWLASNRQFPRHSHDEFGIGMVMFGGHRSWSGRGQVEAGPGELICVNPGEIHDGLPIRGEARGWRMIYARPESLLARETGFADFEFARAAFRDPRTAELFALLFESVVELCPDGMAIEERLTTLFGRLAARHGARSPMRPEAPPAIARAQQRIDDDPARNVTLAELAATAGLSRFQLLRGFARHVGATPHAYLVQRRVRLARRHLLAGLGPAASAAAAGFADQSHLTRAFSRQYGMTPARYQAAAKSA
jgi:AraC-like DNA-binding protein